MDLVVGVKGFDLGGSLLCVKDIAFSVLALGLAAFNCSERFQTS